MQLTGMSGLMIRNKYLSKNIDVYIHAYDVNVLYLVSCFEVERKRKRYALKLYKLRLALQ